MTDQGNLPRRYVEAEVSRILERATQLQREEGPAAHGGGGLTLRELEEIAEEAGIDPRYLRRAASELEPGTAKGAWTWATGEPVSTTLERTIPGEIPDAAFETIVAEIQRTAGALGQPSLLGRTLTWRFETPNTKRTLQVVVTSRGGETHVQVEEGLNQLAGAVFGGLMGGFGGAVGIGVGVPIGMAVLGSAIAAVAFPVGVIGASYVTARTVFSRISRRRRTALHELLDRVCVVVSDAVQDRTGDAEERAGLRRAAPGTPELPPALE